MSFGDLALAALQNYGPPGLIIVYLLWERYARDKREDAREQRHEAIRKDQIDADRELATSIALLTAEIRRV